MGWTKDLFNTEKPIIAMCHIRALPGDLNYNEEKGMSYVVEKAREDFLALQKGGVDAVMFSNEFSLPYLKKVNPETTAAMAAVIGELKSEIKFPLESIFSGILMHHLILQQQQGHVSSGSDERCICRRFGIMG